MDAVIKIGGSVLQSNSVKKLCRTLDQLIRDFSFVIIPGGGEYANLVRKQYTTYNISDDIAHWMAIMSENILGFFLMEYSIFGVPVFTIEEIKKALDDSRIPIFMPFRHLFEFDPLPHSWEVTSDSIAAYLADVLQAQKLILLKDVDGIFTQDPKHSSSVEAKLLETVDLNAIDLFNLPSCIDQYLPTLLRKYSRPCYIVNGLHPDRLIKLLQNEKTINTKIEL